jgi:hypothetical protein
MSLNNNDKNNELNNTSLTSSISKIILEFIKANSNQEHDSRDPFSSKKIPGIPIDYYIERIKKYSGVEDSTLVLTLIYCDKLCGMNNFLIQPHNIHRLFISCCLLAIKFNEDCFYTNEYYAKVGGIDLDEMNYLERSCIELLNFDLFVDQNLYKKYVNYLLNFSNI